MRSEGSRPKFLASIITAMALLLMIGVRLVSRAESKTWHNETSAQAGDTIQEKTAGAMSAGPDNVSTPAQIIDTDTQGKMVVLREGNNGFTCMPATPNVVGEPPICADPASMQRFADAKAHKSKPTNTVPGITYMLAGASQRSDSDPNDTTSMPIDVGPHWMIMWRFDPKTTGLPTTHKPTGAYIMWAGSPYAHVHITCTSGGAHKTIQHVVAFNGGHELWLKQIAS
jgi:hypothetical protein